MPANPVGGTSQISELLLQKFYYDMPEWMDKSNCRDAKDINDLAEMKPLCESCPVRRECAEYAEDKEVTTLVWGGIDFGAREG